MSEAAEKLKVLLIAEEGAGVAALQILSKAAGCEVAGVMTTPPGEGVAGPSVWGTAQKLGHRTLPARGSDFDQPIDLLLNVHSLHRVSDGLISRARIGAFNLHPGPLPRYAGLNVPSWAIYRGESRHGVTLHHMAGRIDAGPIAYQAVFPIADADTGYSLSSRCTREGLRLIAKLLEDAATDPARIPRIAQDVTQREYFDRRVPNEGRLDWTRPAREVLNFIRAACCDPFPSPWGHPRTWLGGREIGVVRASQPVPANAAPGTVLGSPEGGAAAVACGDGQAVVIEKVYADGRYSAASAILRPGDRLKDAR